MKSADQPNSFKIRYVAERGDNFDFGLIGESFVGFNAVFKELCSLTGINGEVEVKLDRVEHGSIEVFNTIHITIVSLPFETISDFLDFLRAASPEMLQEAQQALSQLQHADQAANVFFDKRPFDAAMLMALTPPFFAHCLKWARRLKRGKDAPAVSKHLSKKQATKLRSMIDRGIFKRAFKPVTEGNVKTIELSSIGPFNPTTVKIDEESLGDYLPDDAQILPELENGLIQVFTGRLLALSGTRGECLKIRVHNIDPKHSLLTARPDDGLTTEDFKDLYKQEVAFTAMVYRRSLYKRPELVIMEMHPLQGQLELSDE